MSLYYNIVQVFMSIGKEMLMYLIYDKITLKVYKQIFHPYMYKHVKIS